MPVVIPLSGLELVLEQEEEDEDRIGGTASLNFKLKRETQITSLYDEIGKNQKPHPKVGGVSRMRLLKAGKGYHFGFDLTEMSQVDSGGRILIVQEETAKVPDRSEGPLVAAA